jgi:uncharacterized membrane protein
MENNIEKGKSTAIISYILIVGVLIAMTINAEAKNKFASFHIRQALGLSITFISLGLIISNFNNEMITISMWIFVSILWTYGIITAIKGQTTPMPLVGLLFQKLFKKL